jgi:hypothetical protein
MKFGNLDITDVSNAVFKTVEYRLEKHTGETIEKTVKTTAWERKPAGRYLQNMGDNYTQDYVWVCVNHRVNGVDSPNGSVGTVKDDSLFIWVLKKIYDNPRYDKWFHKNTINMKIEKYK